MDTSRLHLLLDRIGQHQQGQPLAPLVGDPVSTAERDAALRLHEQLTGQQLDTAVLERLFATLPAAPVAVAPAEPPATVPRWKQWLGMADTMPFTDVAHWRRWRRRTGWLALPAAVGGPLLVVGSVWIHLALFHRMVGRFIPQFIQVANRVQASGPTPAQVHQMEAMRAQMDAGWAAFEPWYGVLKICGETGMTLAIAGMLLAMFRLFWEPARVRPVDEWAWSQVEKAQAYLRQRPQHIPITQLEKGRLVRWCKAFYTPKRES